MASKETKSRTLYLGIDATKAALGSAQYGKAVTATGAASVKAGAAVDRYGASVNRAGGAASRAKVALAGMVTGFAAFAALRGAVGVIASFEESMAQVGAVTARSGETMEQAEERFNMLANAAAAAGARTRFSATESAEALLFLGRAGFDAEQATAALPATLNLAAAGGLALGTAADIASNAVSQFGLAAADTSRVGDVLITTSNRANTNVTQLGEAMKFAGPIASKLGISFEATAAAAGVLGNAGIQASLAGTNLRGIMVRLLNPVGKTAAAIEKLGLSLEEVNPEKVGLAGAFRNLANAQLDASSAATIFGRLNVSAALQLAANVDEVERLEDANKRLTGTSQAQAEVVENTLGGALRRFKAAAEGAAIAAGQAGLSGAIGTIADTSAGAIRMLAGIGSEADQASVAVQGLSFAVDGLVVGVAALGSARLLAGASALLTSLKATAAAGIDAALAQKTAAVAAATSASGQVASSALVVASSGALAKSFDATKAAGAGATVTVTGFGKVMIGLRTIIAAHPIGALVTALGAVAIGMGIFRARTAAATREVREQRQAVLGLHDATVDLRTAQSGASSRELAAGVGVIGDRMRATSKAASSLNEVISTGADISRKKLLLLSGASEKTIKALQVGVGSTPAAFAAAREATKDLTPTGVAAKLKEQAAALSSYSNSLEAFGRTAQRVDAAAALNGAARASSRFEERAISAGEAFITLSGVIESGAIGAEEYIKVGRDIPDISTKFDKVTQSVDGQNVTFAKASDVLAALKREYELLSESADHAADREANLAAGVLGTGAAANSAVGSVSRYIEALQNEAFYSQLSRREAEKYRAVNDLLALSKKEGTKLTEEQIQATFDAIDSNKKLAESADSTFGDISSALQRHDFGREIASSFAAGVSNMLTNAGSLKDALSGIFQQISQSAITSGVQGIFESFKSQPSKTPTESPDLSGFSSFFSSMFRSNRGNVFGTGDRKLNRGGFIQSTMADFQIGGSNGAERTTIAEEVPEAVLRLQRDRDGVLGLAMPDGLKPNVTIQQTNNYNIAGGDRDFRRSRRQIQRAQKDGNRRLAGAFGAV